jgi:hypothetical protein
MCWEKLFWWKLMQKIKNKSLIKSVRQREREWLFKPHCTSWSLETACRQSRMFLKKPNPGLKIQIEDFGGTNSWTLSIKQASAQNEPICIACGMEDESAFHLLSNFPSLISLRMHFIFETDSERWRIWGGICVCTAVIRAGKWQIHCGSLIRSFLWTFLLSVRSNSICLFFF